MFKQAGLMACAFVALTAAGAVAQDTPPDKPKQTQIVIKDDATPKAKKAAKAAENAAKKTGDAVTDTSITTAVKTRLMKDKVARGTSIDVDTTDGVVTIAGSVPTEADKARIRKLVENTTGVKSVTDDLTVGKSEGTSGHDETKIVIKDDTTPMVKKGAEKTSDAASKVGAATTDAAITSAVKTKLLADSRVSGMKINVDTSKGIVTLTGDVASMTEKTAALDLARDTKGVKSVVDKLTVR